MASCRGGKWGLENHLKSWKNCLKKLIMLRWKRRGEVYGWNSRGQQSVTQKWEDLVNYEKTAAAEKWAGETGSLEWSMMKVTQLYLLCREMKKQQSIQSDEPPSRSWCRGMKWGEFTLRAFLLTIKHIFSHFFGFSFGLTDFTAWNSSVFKKGGMFTSAWSKFHLNPNWFVPTLPAQLIKCGKKMIK